MNPFHGVPSWTMPQILVPLLASDITAHTNDRCAWSSTMTSLNCMPFANVSGSLDCRLREDRRGVCACSSCDLSAWHIVGARWTLYKCPNDKTSIALLFIASLGRYEKLFSISSLSDLYTLLRLETSQSPSSWPLCFCCSLFLECPSLPC